MSDICSLDYIRKSPKGAYTYIKELEFKNRCLSEYLKEADTKETVVDISEYREPHSVINTGETVHVMPTEVVNQIKAEGIREYGEHLCFVRDGFEAMTPEEYADKLESKDE